MVKDIGSGKFVLAWGHEESRQRTTAALQLELQPPCFEYIRVFLEKLILADIVK
jgi:hypothetical protein